MISDAVASWRPSRLWLLALIPALSGSTSGWSQRKRNRNQEHRRTMFDLVIPRDRTWLRHVAVGLSILSLLTLTVAFAKPKDQVSVPRERATIVVTIDISLSMEAEDVEPNRLDAAKGAAVQFVNSLPPKFNVALVTFAGTATTVVPPTLDRGAVTAAIEASAAGVDRDRRGHLHLAGRPGPGAAGPGQPAARWCRPGSCCSATARPRWADPRTRRPRPPSAQSCRSTPSPTAPPTATSRSAAAGSRCRSTAPSWSGSSRISGGEAYTATSAGELKDVYKDIGSSVGKEKVDREVTSRYAGFGLGFAILAALGMISLGARWP